MKKPIIGILGGMGPRATVDFESRLLSKFPGTDQSIPTIITINDGSIPDRTDYLLGNGPDPIPQLYINAQKLMAVGADIVCMPCNTAHSDEILGRLQQHIDIPLLNMPKACVEFAIKNNAQRVLILGTDGTKASQVFSKQNNAVQCIYPSDQTQQLLMHIIATIKRGQQISNTQLFQLEQGIATRPANLVFLACTELGAIQKQLNNTRVIDSLDILTDQCAYAVRKLYTKNKETIT
jgi:aspartate racemase